jgi:hypothetical protein
MNDEEHKKCAHFPNEENHWRWSARCKKCKHYWMDLFEKEAGSSILQLPVNESAIEAERDSLKVTVLSLDALYLQEKARAEKAKTERDALKKDARMLAEVVVKLYENSPDVHACVVAKRVLEMTNET